MRVFITAGASGIGAAFAEAFIGAGAQVAVVDRDTQALAEFSRRFPDAIAQEADVTDEADLADTISFAEASFGGLDVICANAGTGGPAGPLETLDAEAWRACVDVNLTGAFLTAKHAIPGLKRQGSGLILFTTSTAGQWGYPNRSPYSAAKWALVGLTKGLAMELGSFGIRVNAIAPGAVEGPRMERVLAMEAEARGVDTDIVREDYVKGVSMKTWVTAEDIAATALFLASSAAQRISGQVLAVDGHTETLAP
jgi:NAD(P)-dependent dehydrogenase (short-subunit alcohol dehydrogenase family)